MHDIRAIRDDPAGFDAALARRGMGSQSKTILTIDADRRKEIAVAEGLAAEQKRLGEEGHRSWLTLGPPKPDEELERLSAELTEKLRDLKVAAKEAQLRASAANAKLRDVLLGLPNVPLLEVPIGADETANVELRRWGTRPNQGFKPLEHFDIPAAKPGLDFATAAKLSGSRFVVLRGAMARLHRALGQFMLDLHVTEHGLAETWTPVLVRDEAMVGTGQLPKFAEDSYRTITGEWLIPTSEVTLTNTVAGEMLDEAALPIRLTAHSQCFRSEAGSAGRDTTGMLRQHQFEKVEMVSITTPETSAAEHDRMTGCAEAVLQRLGLPYRVMLLCAGDMGFGATKTHDLEVWLPGQDCYREISSVSVCGDFQARRMNARYRPTGGGKPAFVHTLNGSGLAVGRTLIAVLENGQRADGSVGLPQALHPYLAGRTAIDPSGELV